MAESQKRNPSAVSSKEKDSLLDLDIGNDFLSSWKSMSMAEGDGMDFDLTPGNKKSFNFDKADMDFNFDGDFGKVSSFNMDMSDLDISPPLKNDGKASEKPKESSSGKKKEKPDPFAFAFDFDALDNFNFESSFTKECSKDEKEKSKKVSPPSGSEWQDAEGSVHMKKTGSTAALEDSPPTPSRLGSLGGGGADLESKKENRSSNLEMDDVFTSGHSASIHEITSDQAKRNPKPTVASRELPKDSELEKFVPAEPVEVEACSTNDAVRDLSSDSVPKNGGNPLEAHVKVKSVDTNEMGSSRKKDAKVISLGSSFPLSLPTVEISDHVTNKKQMSSTNDEVRDLSCDSLSKNEPTGPNPSGTKAEDKANPVSTNKTGSTRKHDVNLTSLDSSSCHNPHTEYEISENSSGKSKVGVEDHVVYKMKTPSRNDAVRDSSSEPAGGNPSEAHCKIGSVNTNKTGSTRKQDVKVMSFDSSFHHHTPSVYENSPLHTVEISGKWSSEKSKVEIKGHMMNKMQAPSRNDAERDLPPDSLFKNEPSGGNLSEAKDKVNTVNANASGTTQKKDVNVISFDSSSCHRAHPISESSPFLTADISEKKSSAKSKFRVEDHVLNKQAPSRNGAVRDLTSEHLSKNEPFRVEMINKQTPSGNGAVRDLSSEPLSKNELLKVEDHVLKKQTPSRSGAVRDLSSEPLSKNEPIGGNSSEEQDKINSVNTNATGSDRKEDVMMSLNSSSYHHMFSSKYDSTKSPVRKYIKPVGNIGQNRVLLRNVSSDVTHFPSSQNQTLSTLSMKRKTLEEDSTSTTALPPSKRLTQSLTTSRNVVETPEKVLHAKVPDHSNMETKSIDSTVANSQVPTFHIPHEANIKEVTMPFSIESDNIIKQAESYAKELDDLCNMLKKKHDEAKEILVQSVVNSNELLMLYSPVLDMKILATQNIFARLQL